MRVPSTCNVLTPNGWKSLLGNVPETLTVLCYPQCDVYSTFDLALSRLQLLPRQAYFYQCIPPKEVCLCNPLGSTFRIALEPYATVAVTTLPLDKTKTQPATFLATPFNMMPYPEIVFTIMLKRPPFNAPYIVYTREHLEYPEHAQKLLQAIRMFKRVWYGGKFFSVEILPNEIMKTENRWMSYDFNFFYKWFRLPRWTHFVKKVHGETYRVYKRHLENHKYAEIFRMLSLVMGFPMYFDNENIYLQYYGILNKLIDFPYANFADIIDAYAELKILSNINQIKFSYGNLSTIKSILIGSKVMNFQLHESLPNERYLKHIIMKTLDHLPVSSLLVSEYDMAMMAIQPFVKMNMSIMENRKPFRWTEITTDKTCLVPVMYPNGIILFLQT